MTECVYNAHGRAVGFHFPDMYINVYRLDGSPIGQLNGTQRPRGLDW